MSSQLWFDWAPTAFQSPDNDWLQVSLIFGTDQSEKTELNSTHGIVFPTENTFELWKPLTASHFLCSQSLQFLFLGDCYFYKKNLLSLEYRHQYSKMDHEMVFPQTNWPSFRALEFEFANQRYQHYLKRFIVLMPMLYFSICFSWFFKKHDNLIFIAICEQQGPSVWKVLKFSYFVKITPSKQLDWN